MLATRSLRLAATRWCYSPAVYAWSVQTKTPLKLQQTTTWYTRPMAATYSKDSKSDDKCVKPPPPTPQCNPPPTPQCNQPPSSPSSSASSSSTSSNQRGPLSDLDVKLPSREQMESFFFKSLVYLWDFTFYVYALSRKLIETYVVNNATVQQYWKILMKRMDDARKEIKSK